MSENTKASEDTRRFNRLFDELEATLPPVVDYTTDEYPREGCVVLITVERPPLGITMRVYPPDGTSCGGGAPLEVYGAAAPDAIAVALLDWLRGRPPRRGYQNYRFGDST